MFTPFFKKPKNKKNITSLIISMAKEDSCITGYSVFTEGRLR